MLRSALLALVLSASTPADYTECKLIHTEPLPLPQPGFGRQPDDASLTYPKTDIFDGMPPPRFRAPLTMTVETGSVAKCGEAPSGAVFEACVRSNIVHVPNPCDYPKETFARLLCHEGAHISGWPADHGE